MAELKEITAFLDEVLCLKDFPSDSSNNGLQFEGSRQVCKAVFAVDASNALFCTAADLEADFIFVHHGISWGGSLKRITSLDARRVSLLAASSMSLYAAHLPLDAHKELGHNILLARMLGMEEVLPFARYDGNYIGFHGKLPRTMTLKEIASVYDKALASEGKIRYFGDGAGKIDHIGIVSGGGDFPEAFIEGFELGIDCLISGEMGHTAFHYARESSIAVAALGHYRSETPGVLAVMEKVKERFPDVEVEFVDLPTDL